MSKPRIYETPVVTDIGKLEDLTLSKPKFGPVVPAYRPPKKWGKHSNSSSSGGFSSATTST